MKVGDEVTLAVRDALSGVPLGELEHAVAAEFRAPRGPRGRSQRGTGATGKRLRAPLRGSRTWLSGACRRRRRDAPRRHRRPRRTSRRRSRIPSGVTSGANCGRGATRRARYSSGFGLFGIVGWSVVVPTVGGALAGWALDRHYPGGRSWTLALLIAGLAVGCAVAWHWVARELDLIRHTGEPDDE